MTMKKRGLYSDKSGLSDVVTTLIIVLLVIVAIGIVWAVVGGLIRTGAGNVGFNQKCIDVDVTASAKCPLSASPQLCDITFVRRDTSNYNIINAKVIMRTATVSGTPADLALGTNLGPLGRYSLTGLNDYSVTAADAVSGGEFTLSFNDENGVEKFCSGTRPIEITN